MKVDQNEAKIASAQKTKRRNQLSAKFFIFILGFLGISQNFFHFSDFFRFFFQIFWLKKLSTYFPVLLLVLLTLQALRETENLEFQD